MADKNKKAYLFLGLGLGILIANLALYMSPRVKYREMTDTEITNKAKDLGMVNIKDNIDLGKEAEVEKTSKAKETTQAKETQEDQPGENPADLFVIEEGDNLYDVSEKLMKYKYIQDDKKFNKRVKERELSKKIRYGQYEISKEASFDEIINIITWKDRKK